MEIGILSDILWPLNRIERLARLTKEYEFDQFWISDHPLGRDPFLTLLHLASTLKHVKLGIGTINPSTRHPAVLAASASFLEHLTDGRFWLGIGSSIRPLLEPIGLHLKGQVSRCREAVIIIRQLLENGQSSLNGDIFTTCEARPVFEETHPLPILIGTSGGPKMLQASGEVANGVIIPAGNYKFYEYAISSFYETFAASGRTDPVYIILNGNISVADDTETALKAIRPLVADAILHRTENKHSLKHLGITYDQAMAWHSDPTTIPDDVLREFAIAGTSDECIEGLARLEKLGVYQIAIRFPEEKTVRAVGTHLLPKLRKLKMDRQS